MRSGSAVWAYKIYFANNTISFIMHNISEMISAFDMYFMENRFYVKS